MALLSGQKAPKYSQYTADQFVGTGSQVAFTLSKKPPTPASLIVTIDGIKQHSTTYGISNNVITFTEAPPSGSAIECVAIGTQGITITPSDSSVTESKIAADSISTNRIKDNAVTISKIAAGSTSKSIVDTSATGTGAMFVPYGTTSQRPTTSEVLQRFNTVTNAMEYYYNGQWISTAAYISLVGKNRVTFGMTGGGQSWTVPAGVTSIYVKMWGAGGGGGSYGGWSQGSPGGGGGHTRGIITVTPGQVIAMVVGQGGRAVDAFSGYGGGGIRSTSGSYGSGGGGYTAIFDSVISSGNEVMVSGGGGGGGASRAGPGNFGGGGGGLIGQDGAAQYDGYYSYRGRGGTQSAGGVGGGNAGSKFQGGQANAYGGGGGGGYYGGSGGSYVEDDTMGGGGGGSGYIHPTRVILGELYTASYATPAYYWDQDLQGFAPEHGTPTAMGAQPAGNSQGGTGGSGCIVIYY
jgi:hypothetical protein